jgi:hypothetical protein
MEDMKRAIIIILFSILFCHNIFTQDRDKEIIQKYSNEIIEIEYYQTNSIILKI